MNVSALGSLHSDSVIEADIAYVLTLGMACYILFRFTMHCSLPDAQGNGALLDYQGNTCL